MLSVKLTDQQLNDYLKSRGFELINTGGGCMAWRADFGDEIDYYYLITDPEGGAPIDANDMRIGLYGPAHSEALAETVGDLMEAMHFYEYIGVETYCEMMGEI